MFWLGFGSTVGVSDTNLLSGKRIFVIPEPGINGWWRRLNKPGERQLHTQEYPGNKDRKQFSDILDQLIRNIWNLICQKVPGFRITGFGLESLWLSEREEAQ